MFRNSNNSITKLRKWIALKQRQPACVKRWFRKYNSHSEQEQLNSACDGIDDGN